MSLKRLVAVVTVRNGLVVKSYGYRFWRPAGGLASALRELDSWCVDEIVILDISRKPRLDHRNVAAISQAMVTTPIIYGGGVRTESDVLALLQAGCDRIVLESLLFRNSETTMLLCERFGNQAFVGSIPFFGANHGSPIVRLMGDEDVNAIDMSLDHALRILQVSPVSEFFLIDADNEGFTGQFSLHGCIPKQFLMALNRGLIWFGGIGPEQMRSLLEMPQTAALALGNRLLEREVEYSKVQDQIFAPTDKTNLRPGLTSRIAYNAMKD